MEDAKRKKGHGNMFYLPAFSVCPFYFSRDFPLFSRLSKSFPIFSNPSPDAPATLQLMVVQ